MGKKNRTAVLFAFLLLSMVAFYASAEYNKNAGRLYAHEGMLDISGIEWGDSDKYLLSGQWELYDRVLIGPEELENYKHIMTFTSGGRSSIDPGSHNRTYRLRILTDKIEDLGILIPDISAYRLWINKSSVMDYKLGNKNAKIQRMNTVMIDQEQYSVTPEGYELEIVLEVQDRISYRERPIKIMIGNSSALSNTQNINLVLNTLAIGCYILVAIYSFSLFRKKRSEGYLLYLGLLALNNILANSLDSNILSVIPIFNIRAQGWIRLINLATLFIPIFVFMVCNKLFYGSLAGKKQRLFLAVTSSLAFIIALLPLEITLSRGNLSLYLVRIIVPVNFIIIVSAFLQERCSTLTLGGGFLFAGAFVFEVLVNTGILDVGLVSIYINTSQYAYLIFTIIVVLTVANKFAKKFDEAEKLGTELEYMNKNLEAMVDEKTFELKDSYNKIINLESQRHNLLLNISHDLRSPLFVIKGYMEAINEGLVKDEEALSRYLKRIQSKTEYLSRLIEDLFLVARLEDNKVEFNMVDLDLIPLIEQVINDSEKRASRKNINIAFKPCAHELKIEGDKHRIQQVIDNIIENSIKYTNENGNIHVIIWDEGKKVVINIHDNGIGIAKEDLPHIFDRYYKAVKKGSDEESTGLGLFISREIIEKHGGRVWAESKLEGGTDVYIELAKLDQSAGKYFNK
ncbi:MAG: HAMP domain-containing sensor histidine kinase [Sedimentibacter sp.]|uniref:sensor histidine kinase n=1 Tax=Sedimentibacter sp. TaxID=1960295 RepID=UPI0031586F39